MSLPRPHQLHRFYTPRAIAIVAVLSLFYDPLISAAGVAGVAVLGVGLQALSRSKTPVYRDFAQRWSAAVKDEDKLALLKDFEYESSYIPLAYTSKQRPGTRKSLSPLWSLVKPVFTGIATRIIYPGMMPDGGFHDPLMLELGRVQLHGEPNARRAMVQTHSGMKIDTMYIPSSKPKSKVCSLSVTLPANSFHAYILTAHYLLRGERRVLRARVCGLPTRERVPALHGPRKQ